MLAKINHQHILLGFFVGLMVLHFLWCHFVAYPISFERHLKKGKSWVYIPLRWRGGQKMQIVLVSRILMVLIVALGVVLLSLYTRRASWPWYTGFGVVAGLLVLRLNTLWLMFRYKQQEDAYYYLHDELRARLEGEGKDMGDTAFRNLAAYQHQNFLRKADEQGQLIQTLKSQSRLSRKRRKDVTAPEPVET
jgi:hypothetical protein